MIFTLFLRQKNELCPHAYSLKLRIIFFNAHLILSLCIAWTRHRKVINIDYYNLNGFVALSIERKCVPFQTFEREKLNWLRFIDAWN